MNTFISPSLDAADLLALARLDDDGAPPTVSSPQPADGQTSHAYRVARPGQPAASQAEATGPEHSQKARQAAPAGLGVGWRCPRPTGRKAAAHDTALNRHRRGAGGGWVPTELFHIHSLQGFFNLSTWLTAIAGSAVLLLPTIWSPGGPAAVRHTDEHGDRPGPPGQPPAGGRCAMGTGTGIFLITAGAV